MSASTSGPEASSLLGRILDLARGRGNVANRDGLLSMAIQSSGLVLALLVDLIVSNSLGRSGYGAYSWATTIVQIAVPFVGLGISNLSLKLIPRYRTTGEGRLFHGYLGWSTRSVAISGAFWGAVLAAALAVLPGVPSRGPAVAASLLVPLLAVLAQARSVLMAHRRVAAALAPPFVLRPLLLAIGLIALKEFGRLSATTAVLTAAVAAVVAIIVADLVHRRVDLPRLEGEPEANPGDWIRQALPLMANGGAQIVIRQSDAFMIGPILGVAALAPYKPALQLTNLLVFGLATVGGVAAPRFSALWARGDLAGLQADITRTARLIAGLTLLIAAPIIAFGPWLLNRWGAGTDEAYGALLVLAVGEVANVLVGPAAHLLSVSDHQKLVGRTAVVAGVVNIALNATLIPRFGIMGAAVSTAATTAGMNFGLALFAWRRLGLSMVPFRRL